jgi:hypothetical protein
MFAFERSAIAVLAPLALLALAVAASNMSDDPAPQQAQAVEQPERLRDQEQASSDRRIVVARSDAATRH